MVKTRNYIFLWVVMMAAGIFSLASAEVVDRIVAVVNNEIITLSELNKSTEVYKTNILASQNSDARKKELITELETDMLNNLIDASLTSQEAVKLGIKVTDKEVDSALENFKKQNNLDDESLKQGLASSGMTVADYRERLKDQILQSRLVNRTVRSRVIITDSDVQTYYDAHKDDFVGIKKYQLKNILTQSKKDIRMVEKRLNKNASFAALAKEHSIGSNAAQGGDLGLFDITSFSEDIRTALKELKKGEHTPVMQTGGAYQIIYVDDIIMEGQQTAEQAQEKIQDILYKEQVEAQFKIWIQSLKESAHIKLML